VNFEVIDAYLLGEPVSKAAVLEAFLAARSDLPAAAPFYRALDAVGVRAADEAFVALRLVLAGQTPSDERVRRVRALVALARAAANGDREGVKKAFRRNAESLRDLDHVKIADLAAIGIAARASYRTELAGAR
jgi:flavin-binding protein dodecin